MYYSHINSHMLLGYWHGMLLIVFCYAVGSALLCCCYRALLCCCCKCYVVLMVVLCYAVGSALLKGQYMA